MEFHEDERGFFARYFCQKEFQAYNLNTSWQQINNSMSKEVGTLRGLHFQREPHEEVKLVRCIKGAIWDVVVDLRRQSKTFGNWFGTNLSEENRTLMYVPKGFAHGFITLVENSEIIYLVSDRYEPSAEGILLWSDPDVSIQWPITPFLISKKDAGGMSLKNLMKISARN